jgi:hypothetical protein
MMATSPTSTIITTTATHTRLTKLVIPLLALAFALPASAEALGVRALGGAVPIPATALSPHLTVVVDDALTLADLRTLAPRAAVGLLVPGAGASTDRSYALASLVHGLDLNAALRHARLGHPLIHVVYADVLPSSPDADMIVVGLPESRTLEPNDRRYPIAVVAPGYRGLLTSSTTRIPGLVSIADVAPTALRSVRGSLGHVAAVKPVGRLVELDERIHSNNRMKLPVLLIVAGALLLLMLVRPGAAVPALLAALLTSVVAGAAGIESETALCAMTAIGTVGGGLVIARLCSDDRRLLAGIVLVLAVHVVLLATRPEWVAVSPLGPTQNSRFWGIGNQLETLLLAPVILGASLASRRYGLLGFGAFALFVLTLVTDNRLGSDGGGAIVFGVALAYVGARSHRLGFRGFVVLLGLAASVVLTVVLLNLRAPGTDHLRSAFSHGLSGLGAVLVDRVPLAYLPALHEWPMLVSLAGVLLIVVVLAVRTADRHGRKLVLATVLALVTSLVANDSAVYEVAAGCGVVGAVARFRIPLAPVGAAARGRPALVRRALPTDD